jgi:hypothetical protein
MTALRAAAIVLVSTFMLAPAPVFAQAPSGPGGPPPPGAITRQQFVEQRAEAAGRLFDEIDTGHQGYITRAQLRAFMAQRRAGGAAPPPQSQ